ncbi:MAG: hypothetical protein HY234_09970 [Acidobacteria bacterium]|nr:hypothetical protein [Acidobacteriota bacterium]
MPIPGDEQPKAGIRRFSNYGWFVVGVAVLYAGWMFFSRWQENRQIEQRLLEKQRAEAQRGFEIMGGNRFEILQFYASPGRIRRGETSQLCYGVSNAKTVRIEPPSAAVWPSLSRCFDVAPNKDTTYILTAVDAAGNTRSATVAVNVR